ncbi:MAG TPA: hypothetical protein DCG69_10095 [Bacteroidales bacterium]|nr:hypothetical protein [Bacteroidales bacterium]
MFNGKIICHGWNPKKELPAFRNKFRTASGPTFLLMRIAGSILFLKIKTSQIEKPPILKEYLLILPTQKTDHTKDYV